MCLFVCLLFSALACVALHWGYGILYLCDGMRAFNVLGSAYVSDWHAPLRHIWQGGLKRCMVVFGYLIDQDIC